MTHPAQARDILAQAGFRNVYHLTGGLDGFIQWCLKPVSLRAEPLTAEKAERVRTWRAYFLAEDAPLARVSDPSSGALSIPPLCRPRASSPARRNGLARKEPLPPRRENHRRPPQPAYNTSHIPGAVCLHPESFRGVVGGVPSMLLPADLLAGHVSLMGIEPTHTVVIVPGDALRDATLVGMGFERLRHARWGLLKGGFAEWSSEMRPVTNKLTVVQPTRYPVPSGPAGFTVDRQAVLARVRDGKTVILDTRPADFYTGVKSDEARWSHSRCGQSAIQRRCGPRRSVQAHRRTVPSLHGPDPGQTDAGDRPLPHRTPGEPDLFPAHAAARLQQRLLVRRKLDGLGGA